MSLKIWGRLSSINVRKVVWTAQYLKLPFERVDAGLSYGVVNTPAFKAINPNATIPLMQDGDFSLWESNVIVRYLCEKHSFGELFPSNKEQRFDAERWMDWQQAELNRHSGVPFLQAYRTPVESRDHALLEKTVKSTQALMSILDAHLSKSAFMAGNQLSMADVPILAEVHRWWGVREKLALDAPYPHIERWAAPLLAHPASVGVYDLALS